MNARSIAKQALAGVGRPDLGETIRRLVAYADAGADCLYAPGIRSTDDITAVIKAVAFRSGLTNSGNTH